MTNGNLLQNCIGLNMHSDPVMLSRRKFYSLADQQLIAPNGCHIAKQIQETIYIKAGVTDAEVSDFFDDEEEEEE